MTKPDHGKQLSTAISHAEDSKAQAATVSHAARHGGDALEACRMLGLPLDKILDFSLNVNPFGPPPELYKAIRSNMNRIKSYPTRSYTELKEAIVDYLGGCASSRGISEENIVVGCGAAELIHSFICRFARRGRVVIPLPTFSEYEAAVAAVNLSCAFVEPKGIKVDTDAMLDSASEKDTGMIIICNPNNPTGELLEPPFIGKLLDLTSAKGIYLMVDEAYMDLSDVGLKGSIAPKCLDYPNLIVLKSLTKIFGVPGLRVGYAVCGREAAKKFEETAISWRIGALEESAALAALGVKGFVESSRRMMIEEKARLVEELRNVPGVKVLDSKSNFVLMDIGETGMSPSNLKWRLLSHAVLVRELGGVKGLDGNFIRVCVRGRKENELLVKALRDILLSTPKMGSFKVEECEYRPCHFEGQDCRICFCPFYPCFDTTTGGKFVRGRIGGKIWSCIDCSWIHKKGNTEKVIDELTGHGINVLTSEPGEILGVRKRVLEDAA